MRASASGTAKAEMLRSEVAGGIKGISGVWGISGDGNDRRLRQKVSGSADDGGRRKCVRAVSGRNGGSVWGFGFL